MNRLCQCTSNVPLVRRFPRYTPIRFHGNGSYAAWKEAELYAWGFLGAPFALMAIGGVYETAVGAGKLVVGCVGYLEATPERRKHGIYGIMYGPPKDSSTD